MAVSLSRVGKIASRRGSKIGANWCAFGPQGCFQELISGKLQIFWRDGPCLELIFVSSNFQALLLLQDKLLESV